MRTVIKSAKVAFPSVPPVVPLLSIEPNVFQRVLPGGMSELIREDVIVPGSVVHAYLACSDNPDIVFVDNLCQEIHRLMRTPPIYLSLLLQLSVMYWLAKLIAEKLGLQQ
jgi:hypothetical protein